MRRLAGLVIAAGLWSGQATTTKAQVSFSVGSPLSYAASGRRSGIPRMGRAMASAPTDTPTAA